MGLETIAAITFAVVVILLSAAIFAIKGGRALGTPKWLVRLILGERNNPTTRPQ